MSCVKHSLPIALLLILLWLPGTVFGFSLDDPEKTGLAINMGHSYDPQPNFGFIQLSLMALYDYEQIMPHRAPKRLRFKLEGSLGVADDSRRRAYGSLNFFALYYLGSIKTAKIRPYLEAGAGIIYSDLQVEGQGLRLNFNPQAGIGAEFALNGQSCFSALRVHHVSNGGLYHDNRGINSLLLQIGVYFD